MIASLADLFKLKACEAPFIKNPPPQRVRPLVVKILRCWENILAVVDGK